MAGCWARLRCFLTVNRRMPNLNVRLLFALFTLSGFTGLIYESIWSHYLKLFLGAAAFAQSFGLAALVFHEVFALLTQASLDHVIPALGSPLGVEVYKYTLCGVLIVPQTVLLGMTFPF